MTLYEACCFQYKRSDGSWVVIGPDDQIVYGLLGRRKTPFPSVRIEKEVRSRRNRQRLL